MTKETFKNLARTNIKREGLESLLEALEKSDFYIAPASTKFHDSFEGGLCQHCIKVFEELKKEYALVQGCSVSDLLCGELETIAIVALFHDVCKIGYYAVSYRNVKDEKTGKWEKVPYYSVDDKFPFGHGEKSVFMINEYMRLTPEEALSIRWHMGGFEPKENYPYLSNAYRENPLAVLLHVADMKASYLPK